MQTIGYTISQRIRRPRTEVFHAVVDPEIITSYFCHRISGPLEEGKGVTMTWIVDGKEIVDLLHVTSIIPEEKIVSHWKAWKVEYDVTCTFTFEDKDDDTVVTITENGFHNDDAGRESSYGQCQGWTHMLMCMKARLEFDIDLR